MSSAIARPDQELQMLETMVDCAYALGMAVGEAAKAEADSKRSFALYDLFHRSFLAVRMGIRLSLALRAAPKLARPAAPGARENDPHEREDEAERPQRGDPVERERERDYEPVSLPRFLSTLGLVARDADCLEGLPAEVRTRELPALQALLAAFKSGPAPARETSAGMTLLSRPSPKPPPASRAALLGSTASTARPARRDKRSWSGSG